MSDRKQQTLFFLAGANTRARNRSYDLDALFIFATQTLPHTALHEPHSQKASKERDGVLPLSSTAELINFLSIALHFLLTAGSLGML